MFKRRSSLVETGSLAEDTEKQLKLDTSLRAVDLLSTPDGSEASVSEASRRSVRSFFSPLNVRPKMSTSASLGPMVSSSSACGQEGGLHRWEPPERSVHVLAIRRSAQARESLGAQTKGAPRLADDPLGAAWDARPEGQHGSVSTPGR